MFACALLCRLHKKCVEEARRRLEEYQHTLKLRYTIGSTSAALQQPSVPLETPSAHRPALPLVLNPDAHVLHPGEAPAPSQPPQPKPSGSESSSPQGGQEDRVPEQDRLPLPPPSVVLELLRSRQHHAVPRSSEVSGSVTELSFGPVQTSVRSVPLLQSEPCLETDRQELRRQRDLLQALITADRQVNLTCLFSPSVFKPAVFLNQCFELCITSSSPSVKRGCSGRVQRRASVMFRQTGRL